VAPHLVVGGSFQHAGANSTGQINAFGLAEWDGTAWTGLGLSGYPYGSTSALGTFMSSSGAPLLISADTYLGSRDSAGRHNLGPFSDVTSMVSFDPDGDGPLPSELVVAGVHVYQYVGDPEHGGITWEDVYDYADVSSGVGSVSPTWTDMMEAPCNALTTIPDGAGGWTMAAGLPAAPYMAALVSNPNPSVVTQPVGGLAHRGGSIELSMVANAPVTYEWRCLVGNSPLTLRDRTEADGTTCSGTTTANLRIDNIGTSMTGYFNPGGPYSMVSFWCVITDPCHQTASTQMATFRISRCSADFNHDGGAATDADIEAFFACMAGNCCTRCDGPDFNGDGAVATDADIESFFRVLAGGPC
jgi:hypothetical protein